MLNGVRDARRDLAPPDLYWPEPARAITTVKASAAAVTMGPGMKNFASIEAQQTFAELTDAFLPPALASVPRPPAELAGEFKARFPGR
ncbi:MAG: hypothetical protein L0Y57_03735 [Beijerinckiaceae bacterium]|nr:hypothetical protein [Beijerinckiaceae bacterium]